MEFECATEAKTVVDLNELPLFHGKHLKIKRRSLKEPPTRKLQATPRNRGQRIGDAVKARHFLDKDVMDELKRANTVWDGNANGDEKMRTRDKMWIDSYMRFAVERIFSIIKTALIFKVQSVIKSTFASIFSLRLL